MNSWHWIYINLSAKHQPKVVGTPAIKQKNLVFKYSAGHRHGSCKTSETAAAQKHVELHSVHHGTNSHPFQEKTTEKTIHLPYNMKLLFVQSPLHQNSANNQEKPGVRTRNSSGIFNQLLI